MYTSSVNTILRVRHQVINAAVYFTVYFSFSC